MANHIADLPEMVNRNKFVYENDMTRRIRAVHTIPYDMWADTAWAVMLIRQKLIPSAYVGSIVGTITELWNDPEEIAKRGISGTAGTGFAAIEKYIITRYGAEVGGSLTMGRTIPPARQTLPVRHELLVVMCCMMDYIEALLHCADEHKDAVMPGYTHCRHAQPTTFGHYLLSVADPTMRIFRQIESGYSAMNLNELGCGALSGVSWNIDRNRVSEYLGFDGLVENANDAVSYTDGYVALVSALANVMVVSSRMAQDLNIWSGLEHNFMHIPWLGELIGGMRGKSHSHFMPQKTANMPYLEKLRAGAAALIGDLNETVALGLRTPHGDVHEMLAFGNTARRALQTVFDKLHVFIYTFPRITVNRERMLEMASTGYSCATELANQIVRDYDVSYHTAHDIVHEFVRLSEQAAIPASRADVGLLEQAAGQVVSRRLGMSEARLRELLHPAYFIEVTTSQGGASVGETARMIGQRREQLAAMRDRHEQRVQRLEHGRRLLESDLQSMRE